VLFPYHRHSWTLLGKIDFYWAGLVRARISDELRRTRASKPAQLSAFPVPSNFRSEFHGPQGFDPRGIGLAEIHFVDDIWFALSLVFTLKKEE